jgi:hypothetical protein
VIWGHQKARVAGRGGRQFADLRASLGLVCVLLAGIVSPIRAAHAQTASPETLRYFRAEWDPEPVPRAGSPTLQGYVYSTFDYRVGSVRIQVDIVGAGGQVEDHALGWVYGDIPAHGRAYFSVPLPRTGATYRVTVLSFVPISREAP